MADVDLGHATGLTEAAYDRLAKAVPGAGADRLAFYGVPFIVQTDTEGYAVRYVPEAEYAKLQDELDELRRTVALINVAFRFGRQRSGFEVGKLLDSAGQGYDQARALLGVLDWARRSGHVVAGGDQPDA